MFALDTNCKGKVKKGQKNSVSWLPSLDKQWLATSKETTYIESQTACITYQGLLSLVLSAFIPPISYFMIVFTFISVI